MMMKSWIPKEAEGSLYDPIFEHDACGVGFVTRTSATQTHDIVTMALEAVKNLSHRGALDADGKSGDGAGILVQIPKRFMAHEARKLGFRLDVGDRLGVAMAFLPPTEPQTQQARDIIESKAQARGLQALAWRSVAIDMDALGEKARSTAPKIEQLLVLPPEGMDDTKYEQTLYLVRKEAEAEFTVQGLECYLPSFSHRTLIYKGLMVAGQIPKFYLDLQDPTFESALALFHQRYSTNTFPTWHLAQPFRMLAHNGEINTLQGNTNWMRAREPELESEVWGADVKKLSPIIVPGGSDSAMLDNALEAIVLSGRDVRHAMLMLVPEAWERMPHLDPAWREF
jgi:glutamate synthase domain-containing protein 1